MGCGRGPEGEKLTPEERKAHRDHAHDWLRGQMLAWRALASRGTPQGRNDAGAKLQSWLSEPLLSGMRPGPDRVELTDDERSKWDALWDGIRAEAKK